MNRWTIMIAAALALPALPGPAARAAPPPNGGTIAIQARTTNGDSDPAMPAFVEAASDALAARGFVILDDPAHAASVADLILDHAGVGTALGKSAQGASVGVAGGGVVLALPTGKSSFVPLQRTRLEIRIRKRGDTEVAWHGAAITVRTAGADPAKNRSVATDLSNALLASYPVQPGDVIGVP